MVRVVSFQVSIFVNGQNLHLISKKLISKSFDMKIDEIDENPCLGMKCWNGDTRHDHGDTRHDHGDTMRGGERSSQRRPKVVSLKPRNWPLLAGIGLVGRFHCKYFEKCALSDKTGSYYKDLRFGQNEASRGPMTKMRPLEMRLTKSDKT